jgi:hypothetical protein
MELAGARKNLLLVLATTLLTVALALGLLDLRRTYMLREGLRLVHLAVERYAVEHAGSYPTSLHELEAQGYIADWPRNPYGKGEMAILRPLDKPRPGALVYIAFGPLVALGQPPADGEVKYELECDQYLLGVYGALSPLQLERFKRAAPRWAKPGTNSTQPGRRKLTVDGQDIWLPAMPGAGSAELMRFDYLLPGYHALACLATPGEQLRPRSLSMRLLPN